MKNQYSPITDITTAESSKNMFQISTAYETYKYMSYNLSVHMALSLTIVLFRMQGCISDCVMDIAQIMLICNFYGYIYNKLYDIYIEKRSLECKHKRAERIKKYTRLIYIVITPKLILWCIAIYVDSYKMSYILSSGAIYFCVWLLVLENIRLEHIFKPTVYLLTVLCRFILVIGTMIYLLPLQSGSVVFAIQNAYIPLGYIFGCLWFFIGQGNELSQHRLGKQTIYTWINFIVMHKLLYAYIQHVKKQLFDQMSVPIAE